MTRKAVSALLAQAAATIEDNVLGNITAADMRAMVVDIIDTLKPGYAAVTKATALLAQLGPTPVVVPLDTVLISTTEFQLLPVTSGVQRLGGGLPSVSNRITFSTAVDSANNAAIVFTLYRDGVAVAGSVTVVARGIGTGTLASFTTVNSTVGPGDPTFDVRASKPSGGLVDVTLLNTRLVVEIVPTL